jgi:hypothetical protein
MSVLLVWMKFYVEAFRQISSSDHIGPLQKLHCTRGSCVLKLKYIKLLKFYSAHVRKDL